MKWELLVLMNERGKGDGLPVGRALTPDQRNRHLAAGRSAKVYPACVLLAFDQSEARLPDTVRGSGIKLDARALVADKRLVLVRHHDFVGANRAPFAKLHVTEGAARLRGRSIRLFG